jgi:hypothetical protein
MRLLKTRLRVLRAEREWTQAEFTSAGTIWSTCELQKSSSTEARRFAWQYSHLYWLFCRRRESSDSIYGCGQVRRLQLHHS